MSTCVFTRSARILFKASIPFKSRHRDVKNQHLGLQALRELHCFDSILGFSDNLELAILLQQRPNPLPHQVVVFRQNNPNHSFFLLGILRRGECRWPGRHDLQLTA